MCGSNFDGMGVLFHFLDFLGLKNGFVPPLGGGGACACGTWVGGGRRKVRAARRIAIFTIFEAIFHYTLTVWYYFSNTGHWQCFYPASDSTSD